MAKAAGRAGLGSKEISVKFAMSGNHPTGEFMQADHYTSMDFTGEFGMLSFKATRQVEINKWESLEREEMRSDRGSGGASTI